MKEREREMKYEKVFAHTMVKRDGKKTVEESIVRALQQLSELFEGVRMQLMSKI